MLYLTRLKDESVVLSGVHDAHGNLLDDIEIVILPNDKVGISADKKITILRKELVQRYFQDGTQKVLQK
ncbi:MULTISPECIES: carbon storage regulator [unclassified Shewanella]|uniref:carbon storage regulator n=1 Tax=unclassified Shewanella TaxID=196818 RepID=UPI000C859508|nr:MULTISPECIES: carbon storage regulator [unclassified Shewanella]MDO6620174.1 carbon storage regulator [Shewanella sp. 6_MG-2023]MDO6641591.1 carbon storage regulator [Shewanella sp. 5_MG-2023]MDO6777457.1 carbon storage regulator [Shewanella sp. 3_MG-2023]PMG31691.1 hypothetical protein BCU94_07025 [Shewanella sp. 10N.286.52.C2]PMH87765.1 hypothetical protein BCU57_05400 [Shewanella sp. 10N.286.48.B5]